MFEKLCKNNCGMWIKWDIKENCFKEVHSGRRHRCSNYKPQQQHQQASTTTEQTLLEQLLPILQRIEQLLIGLKESRSS